MPINKPIPDSVINYWKKVFKDFQAKFSGPKKSVWNGWKKQYLKGGEGSEEFYKPSLLHLWSTPLISKKGVGKPYLNRTSILKKFFLCFIHARASNFY